MLKAIWMSDPHFASEGDVLGHDPRVRLQSAVDHINQHHNDAEYCIISGDLVNRGTIADYSALKKQLDQLVVPILPLAGNHDDRSLLRSVLPLPDTCMTDFIQYTIPTQHGVVICLDTQKTGSDAGEFCVTRRAWLQDVLEELGAKPAYIFMHHPPMPLGLPMQDTENMVNGDVFLDLVSAYDCVKYLFIGHVHRPISGVVRGIPFSTMRSVLYQAPAPRPDWTWDTFEPSEEAPNLGVITMSECAVNLQFVQFCKFETGVDGTW